MRQFDLVTANPMWNQKFAAGTYENDTYERFGRGMPPVIQRRLGLGAAHGRLLDDGGRMAVVLDTGAVSRGSGNQGSNKERDIRKAFVEARPDRGGAPAAGEPVLQHHRAGHRHGDQPRASGIPGEILLINASEAVRQGPAQELPGGAAHRPDRRGVPRLAGRGGLSAVITTAEAAKNDYNLSPQPLCGHGRARRKSCRWTKPWSAAEAEEERAEADRELDKVLAKLGFADWRGGGNNGVQR